MPISAVILISHFFYTSITQDSNPHLHSTTSTRIIQVPPNANLKPLLYQKQVNHPQSSSPQHHPTIRHVSPINPLLSTHPSSANFLLASSPTTGNLTSTFPFAPSTSNGNGTHSGSKPNCFSALAWSHAICSWQRRSPLSATTLVNASSRRLPVGGMPGSSQGMCDVWVKEKMNSSMMRSVPMVRETRDRDVSGGLEKIKWCV